jgi:hypothetical protein
MSCLTLQGTPGGLRFDWESLDRQSWPNDVPTDIAFRALPTQYGISAIAPRQLSPGRPLALELQELEAFLIQPVNVARGTPPLSQTTIDTDIKGKLHMYMGFLLLHDRIMVSAHNLAASFVVFESAIRPMH